ncbi:MAG: hypothetical protein CVV42_02380 [Candidatus Riflebacteria bacterium HGW-Riflebacteria-2]|jgi:hypothetical protein|nr:MAG: hypothetical protein CVV42_02380 [Candidatus Riflebacteria bacterium HGW-Riflebacteria-2]
MMRKLSLKKGNVTVILLGLISVMLIMVMGLSRRMSSHSQLLTLSDYTQISRYFLESYAGDVLQQINLDVNKPGSALYEAFREPPSNRELSTDFYEKSGMLSEMEEELGIEIVSPLTITFSGSEEIGYPPGFQCPPHLKGTEKRGLLEIVCRARFYGRVYTLRVQYPFTVVMRMTPVLKDFVLFADRIAREQGDDKIGPNDNLNIMLTRDGKHPDIFESGIVNHNSLQPGNRYRPMVMLPPLDPIEYASSAVSGKIFLGPADESIFLNLAGDTREEEVDTVGQAGSGLIRASSGEMFLVTPDIFKVFDSASKYQHMTVFQKPDGSPVRMMGMEVPIKYNQLAKMGILGFSQEIVPQYSESIFSGAAYTVENFLNTGSSASEFWRKLKDGGSGYGEGFMALSSGLKLMGIKPDDINFGHVNREIFGNVLSRFFVLTFWWPPSGGGVPLEYDENRSPNDFPTTTVSLYTYKFEPLYSNLKFQDFMSRMVSGKNWNPGVSGVANPPEGFMPYNYGPDKANPDKMKKQILSNFDFSAADGFTAGERLDRMMSNWFRVTSDNSPQLNGIDVRIGRAFASGEEFLEAAGYETGKFMVNGVVYVAGPLEVPELDMENENIGGGVILVDGPIELHNITRGYKLDTNDFKLGAYGAMLFRGPAFDHYQKWKTEITQENFLTFVSLRGDAITISGEALLGVHLVNLNPLQSSPYDQIVWARSVRKEIVFCGGIACNFLNLPKRLLEFGTIDNSCDHLRAPFFIYHSAMASSEPAYAVQLMENMRGYMLTAERAPGEDD